MRERFSSGAALALFETLDSTSLEARRRADAGARGPIWILALEQTAGYGRRGSGWEQAPGDVAATFLFDPGAPVEKLGQLSFVAALAVADAVRRFAPRAPIALKWPNDVLVGGGKIAGILLELLKPEGGGLIALGVGLNIVTRPVLAEYPTARLLDFLEGQPAPSPEAFVHVLDETLHHWRGAWKSGGFQPIRDAWLAAAAGKGEKIRVRLPQETIEGVFADLDSTGALVLDCESGRRTVAAGTVVRV